MIPSCGNSCRRYWQGESDDDGRTFFFFFFFWRKRGAAVLTDRDASQQQPNFTIHHACPWTISTLNNANP